MLANRAEHSAPQRPPGKPGSRDTAANVVGRIAGTLVVASTELNMPTRDILYDRRQLSPEEITFRGGPQAES